MSVLLAATLSLCTAMSTDDALFRLTLEDITGRPVPLSKFRGDVLLIVNVASKCGLTPQYAEMQTLYEKYKARGFTVLAFPCNQFNNQEPGTNKEIAEFCTKNYGVTFPVFSKLDVNGKQRSELYTWLLSRAGDEKDIEWNFAKFLVSRDGARVVRFPARTKPSDPTIVGAIEAELNRPL